MTESIPQLLGVSNPLPGLKLLGPAALPSSCRRREPLVLQPTAPALPLGIDSVPLAVALCTSSTWYSPGSHALLTGSLMWWLISHLHAFRPGLADLSGPRVRPGPSPAW